MATQKSSGVVSWVPSTFPTSVLSRLVESSPGRPFRTVGSDTLQLLEEGRLDGAMDEFGIAEPVAQTHLERTDGIQVLRRARVAPRCAGERWQGRTGDIGQRLRRAEALI